MIDGILFSLFMKNRSSLIREWQLEVTLEGPMKTFRWQCQIPRVFFTSKCYTWFLLFFPCVICMGLNVSVLSRDFSYFIFFCHHTLNLLSRTISLTLGSLFMGYPMSCYFKVLTVSLTSACFLKGYLHVLQPYITICTLLIYY